MNNNDNKKNKKGNGKGDMKMKAIEVDIIMSLFVGVVLGFFLPLIGMLRSAHFSIQGFAMGFFMSFLVSVILGFVIPARRVNLSINRKFKLRYNSIGTLFINALVTDVLYVPIITAFVATLSYRKSIAMGAMINYPEMLIKAIAVSLVIGYMLVFITFPYFLKLACKILRITEKDLLDHYEDSFVIIKREDEDVS